MHTFMHIYAMFDQLNIRFSMNTFDELLHVNLLIVVIYFMNCRLNMQEINCHTAACI